MRNPAAVYCDALGYAYTIEKDADGNDVGYCAVSKKEKVDAWAFLQGAVGDEQSYCAKRGLPQVVVNGSACARFLTTTCAACLVNGTQIEVTALMGLDFKETICGDTHCGFPESHDNCPADCPASGLDMACDGTRDGACDPDCDGSTTDRSDPDCPGQARGLPAGIWILIVLAVFAAAAFLLLRKKR